MPGKWVYVGGPSGPTGQGGTAQVREGLMGKVRLLQGLVVLSVFVMALPLLGQPQGEEVRLGDVLTLRLTAPWRVADKTRNSVEIVRPGEKGGVIEARMLVTFESRRDHGDALDRLSQIALEQRQIGKFTIVAGWPAYERVYRFPFPTVGREDEKDAGPVVQSNTYWVTTAVAAADRLIRLETTLRPEAGLNIADEALAIGRTVRPAKYGDEGVSKREALELQRRRSTAARPPAAVPPTAPTPGEPRRPGGGKGESSVGVPVNARAGFGELEIVASANGQNVALATNAGGAWSNNGGTTFNAGTAGSPAGFPADGDPSLALGATGNMYWAFIGYPDGSVAAAGATGCSNSVSTSTNNGQTFNFTSHSVVCPNGGAICFPDQEHIAADRLNLAAGNDQLYVAWRNFTPSGTPTSCQFNTGFVAMRLTCSSDSAATWPTTVAIGAGDFPRVTVGRDGFVYAAYRSGANVMLNKFSSCSTGLVQQVGFPVTVAAFTDVPCPVAGLDRCNSGNVLSSPTAAVDDLDGNHVYVAWATSTVAGNENVIVADSMNGGSTFPRTVVLNDAVAGHRFMPWLSTYGGVAYVSWYDRSMAAASNDQTRYFGGSASVKAGNLVRGTQIDISQATDTQCSTWPCRPRATADSDSCTVQPQLAGRCRNGMGGGSNTPCDYSLGGCPVGETCTTGSGCPKYGDYNGNGAIAGRWYVAWASVVPPPAVVAPGPGINVYADALVQPSDFFVRDWTVSASDHDTGPEPSTNPVFYQTSDVWSQQTVSPPNAPVNDWVQGDLARKGASTAGDNWAFVRVSRRAAAAPTAPPIDVTAQFYVADYGLGTSYSAVGGPQTLTFNAADLTKTLATGVPWHLDASASIHVCLGVEINAPSDPMQAPSLLGQTPGPADPLITIDNNKAQRNIDTVSGSGAAGLSGYAIVRNSQKELRDINLIYEIPFDLCRRLRGVRASIDGALEELGCQGELTFRDMRPGESRWLEVSFGAFDAKPGQILPITFTEFGPIAPASGFVLGVRAERPEDVFAENITEHAITFTRMLKGFRISAAEAALKGFDEIGRKQSVDADTYRNRLKKNRSAIIRAAESVTQEKRDTLRLAAKVAAFAKALRQNAPVDVLAAAHSSLLRAIDARLTQLRMGKMER
jgi:hypothetical protein